MKTIEGKIDNAQEFECFYVWKSMDGLENRPYWRSKMTILLSEMQDIRPVHEDDRTEKETPETWVSMKNGDEDSALIVEYEDLRKIWLRFLRQ
jgi:hypothetical protein